MSHRSTRSTEVVHTEEGTKPQVTRVVQGVAQPGPPTGRSKAQVRAPSRWTTHGPDAAVHAVQGHGPCPDLRKRDVDHSSRSTSAFPQVRPGGPPVPLQGHALVDQGDPPTVQAARARGSTRRRGRNDARARHRRADIPLTRPPKAAWAQGSWSDLLILSQMVGVG